MAGGRLRGLGDSAPDYPSHGSRQLAWGDSVTIVQLRVQTSGCGNPFRDMTTFGVELAT